MIVGRVGKRLGFRIRRDAGPDKIRFWSAQADYARAVVRKKSGTRPCPCWWNRPKMQQAWSRHGEPRAGLPMRESARHPIPTAQGTA